MWDDNGTVTVHNADGSQEVYVHDQRARLVQRIDPDGAQHFKSYDEKGRLTVEQDPLGAVTAYQYDEAGRLIALFPGDDAPISYEHDNGFVRVVRRVVPIMERSTVSGPVHRFSSARDLSLTLQGQ